MPMRRTVFTASNTRGEEIRVVVMPRRQAVGELFGRLNSTSVIMTLQWLEANARACSASGAKPGTRAEQRSIDGDDTQFDLSVLAAVGLHAVQGHRAITVVLATDRTECHPLAEMSAQHAGGLLCIESAV